jgi:hypothetical protein
MKSYVLLALLFTFSISCVWAQTSSEIAQHTNRNKTEGGSEQIQVKVFPNPFSEKVEFQFDITEPSQVNLTIFDITGRKVAVLVDSRLKTDVYSLRWKPTHLLSGMYIYVFSAGRARKIGKIILLSSYI